MTAHVVRIRARRAMAGAMAVLAVGVSLAVPVGQNDPVARSGTAAVVPVPVEPLDAEVTTEPTSRRWVPDGRRRSDPLPPEPPASAATLPRHVPSVALVDDDPRVDFADVVGSVARATTTALPWLRLGSGAHDDARRRRDAVRADADAETARKLESASLHRADPVTGSDAGPAPDPGLHVNLIDEAIEIARDFITHPLTWIFGVPVLLAGFMVAVLRGRGK